MLMDQQESWFLCLRLCLWLNSQSSASRVSSMTAPTHLSRMKGLTLPTGRTDMVSRTITTQVWCTCLLRNLLFITFFAGSNYGNHVCDCFYDSEGCIESETLMNRCNCDSTLPIPLTDTGTKKDVFCLQSNIFKGIITNTTALPVTKLYFGGLIYDVQSGAFLLGRLKCYGKNKVLALKACASFISKIHGICLQS